MEELFKGKDIVIAPFNIDSVICFHQLERQGILTNGFFDSNPFLEGKCYEGRYITTMWRRMNTIVIITGIHCEEIGQQLLELGYPQEDIIRYSELELDIDEYEASCAVDLDKYIAISPYRAKAYGERLKVRKLRKLKELGAPKKYLNYDMYDESNDIHDCYIDNNGSKHIILKNIDLVLTTRCSLKCKYCCNGMQYFEKPQDIALDSIIGDYNRLLQAVEWVDRLVLVGGGSFT